tara:strand:+ start:92 stop:622 length:531 start_codon:yes stop_codon:yes gene_type:complete
MRKKIIITHILLFIILSIVLIFTLEELLNLFGFFHTLTIFLYSLVTVLICLFIILLISCLIFLSKRKRKTIIEKVELINDGFKIILNEDITQFKWTEIEKLTGFKVDRLTVDDICLKIESNNKTAFATEEFEGWRNFIDRILIEFPLIDKNWEGIIAKPAFERNETELYNRGKNVG